MSAPGPFRAVIVEAVVVQQRAAAAQMAPRTERRGQFGRQDRHIGPIEQRIFEEIVANAFLDRRQAAPMAVRVHQTGHQQLRAVAEDAAPGYFGAIPAYGPVSATMPSVMATAPAGITPVG